MPIQQPPVLNILQQITTNIVILNINVFSLHSEGQQSKLGITALNQDKSRIEFLLEQRKNLLGENLGRKGLLPFLVSRIHLHAWTGGPFN